MGTQQSSITNLQLAEGREHMVEWNTVFRLALPYFPRHRGPVKVGSATYAHMRSLIAARTPSAPPSAAPPFARLPPFFFPFRLFGLEKLMHSVVPYVIPLLLRCKSQGVAFELPTAGMKA